MDQADAIFEAVPVATSNYSEAQKAMLIESKKKDGIYPSILHSNALLGNSSAMKIEIKYFHFFIAAKIHVNAGQFNEALILYTEALAIDPLNDTINATLYFNRALMKFKIGERQFKLWEVIVDLNNALEMKADYIKALLMRAKVYKNLQMFKKAMNDLERVCNLPYQDTEANRLELKDAKLREWLWQTDAHFILGVEIEATSSEIKRAFKQLSLQHHTDKIVGAPDDLMLEHAAIFKKISVVYGILCDPEKREKYDEGSLSIEKICK